MANNTQDKRNAKGGGSVRQRPDGRWEARCTINGKSRSFYADKQQDALKAMRAAQKAADEGQYLEPSKMTVGQWLDIWLEEFERPQVRYGTYIKCKSNVNHNIVPALGKIKLQALTSTHIQSFINDLQKKGIQSREIYATLRTALNKAVMLKYITTNPGDACSLPKKEKKEISPLSDNDVKNFLKAIEGHKHQALFTVTLFTGMRKGEILGLPWDAVDFKNGTITIKQQLHTQHGRREIGPTKNGRSRTIAPAPFVMDILRNVRQEQFKNQIKLGSEWNNEFNLVFTDETGHNCTHNVYLSFKNVVSKIGRPDARFHDLRHTYAVMSLQEGDSLKTVQENLGHTTASMTLGVYAHVSEKMKLESANRMQNYYEKIQA